MGFWQRVAAPFRRMFNVDRDQPVRYFQYFMGDQPAGVFITSDNALQLSVVWACCMAITNAIAPSKWNVFSLDGGRRTKLPDDPLAYLLNVRPNPDMTAIAFKESLSLQALTWGNSYAEIVRTNSGKVAQLWPLMSHRMVPRRETVEPYALYYEYQQEMGGTVRLEARDVYHLRGPGISGLMGDNLVARGARSMSLAAAQERFASTYFGNNTVVGGVLSTPGKLQKDAFDRLKQDWEDRHKGPHKSNRPVILEGGMKWEPIGNNAEEAQIIPSRQFSVEDICRWYGVPPHKVQHLLRATFNNIEHLGIEFARDAVTPWAVRWKQEADFKLLSARGPLRETAMDLGWLTQGDAKSRMEAYQIARRTGIYTINECREMEGKNAIGPEGDVRMVESNMQTLEQLEAGAGPGGSGSSGQEEPGDEGESDTTSEDGDAATSPDNLLVEALQAMFAGVFDRYRRRLDNRAADLRRGGADDLKVAAHLADERLKLRSWVLDESADAQALALRALRPVADVGDAVVQAIDAVNNGTEPDEAARALVATLKETR